MKFLVTGGAGFIGSHIAEGLIASGRGDVLVVDNLSVGRVENVPKQCKFYQCDIRNTQKLSRIFKTVDIIFHNAAFVSIRASFDTKLLREELETNCIGTLNVLEASVKARVKKIIFASSMAVYGQPQYLPVDENHPTLPISPYGLSKLRGEYFCRIFQERFGLPAVILRYFNTFGVRQGVSDYVGVITTFINQLLKNRPITIFGDGKQTRDFVSVKDVVQANLLAAFSDINGTFNVASGQDISIKTLAVLLLKTYGRGRIMNLERPHGEIDKIRARLSKIRRELGYKPTGDLAKDVSLLLEWWKNKS